MSATAVPPSPVARVIGAPAAPLGAAAPARPAAAGGGVAGLLQNRTALMLAGVVLVGGFALIRAKMGSAGPDQGTGAAPQGYTIDTSQTDLYGDLQPELEQINDALDDLRKNPRPPVPTPPPTPKPPSTNVPSPKPKPATGWQQHTIQKGQNYQYIAALYSTTVGRLFMSNIKGRIRADGTPGVLVSYADFKPGVRLVIPKAIIGQNK